MSGSVTSADGPDPTQAYVRILLDDNPIGELAGELASVLPFQHSVTVPDDTLEGEHLLFLEFPAQGPYIAASAMRTIQIVRVRPELSVHAPGVTFLPRALKVSGTVTSAFGPLQGTQVLLDFGGTTTTSTTDDHGNFSRSLDLSLMGAFLGPQSLRVSVVPEEPWHNPVEREVRVFIVNVTNLGLLVVLVSYVGVLGTFAWRRRRAAGPLAAPEAAWPRVGEPGYVPVQEPRLRVPSLPFAKAGSLRACIVSSYYSAAHFLAAQRATPLFPSFTLRDFLRAVGVQIRSPFAELTRLAERALYRSPDPEETDPQRAEELSEQVKEES